MVDAVHELILGGQRSGKSRRAESLAVDWLAASPHHSAVFIATAQPWDDEMRARITRHQQDRAVRLPGMRTVEEPLHVAQAITQHSQPGVMVVIDCLTLWLSNWTVPNEAPNTTPNTTLNTTLNSELIQPLAQTSYVPTAVLLEAISAATGPLVLVSNEIGLGVIPMGLEVRAYVDALGRLNQDVAQCCQRVTLMAAGLPLSLKAPA